MRADLLGLRRSRRQWHGGSQRARRGLTGSWSRNFAAAATWQSAAGSAAGPPSPAAAPFLPATFSRSRPAQAHGDRPGPARCSRLLEAGRSWPTHRVARHDPSSTTSSPCCPSSQAVCARSDCPWPRLARLTARDARRSLAQIAWSRSLAHSSNFRGGGEDLVTRLTAGAPAQASSGGICPRRFRAAPRPCAPPPPPRRPRTGPWARRRRLGVDGGEVAWCHVGRECPQFNVYKLLSTCS